MTHFLGRVASARPRSAGQCRAQGSTTRKQAHRQVSGHCDPAIRATMTQACARGEEDPNGRPRSYPSSGHRQPLLGQARTWQRRPCSWTCYPRPLRMGWTGCTASWGKSSPSPPHSWWSVPDGARPMTRPLVQTYWCFLHQQEYVGQDRAF
jgi:hypothetical protein